jgi:hypothetical protein
MSPSSSASQLDDKQQYPLFARLATNAAGPAVPFVLYLKEKNVKHVGVIHESNEYGTTYLSAILEEAERSYPELKVFAVDLPQTSVSVDGYTLAMASLRKTGYRWFYVIGVDTLELPGMVEAAISAGIAGTEDYVWFYSAILGDLNGLIVENNSPTAITMHGSGQLIRLGGREGEPVYDSFISRYKSLGSLENLAYIQEKAPVYPNDLDYPGMDAASYTDHDPTTTATFTFDETIMFGLAACEVAAQTNSTSFDGKAMYDALLSTTFQGSTGFVAVDPKTGSRRPETAYFKLVNFLHEPFNETHVIFKRHDSSAFADSEWVEQKRFVFNSGSTTIPSDLPPLSLNPNYIGTSLRATGLAMAGTILFLSVTCATWTTRKSSSVVVQASQPIFLLILCAGTFVMGAAIIPFSIDDELASEDGCDIACMAAPWLTATGVALIFAALFSKTWRVNRLFQNGRGMRRVKVTARDVMAPLICLMALNFIMLTLWTVLSPLTWVREVITVDEFGRSTESRGYCRSDNSLPFVIALLTVDLGALVFVSYQAYMARNISTEFAESEYIGKAIACKFA